MTQVEADFDAAMSQCLAQGAPWPGAVAVSGGADSLALMFLLEAWARKHSRSPPVVLSIDHGLSPDSSKIARGVEKRAKALKLQARKLVWAGAKPVSDLEAAAREARYALMGKVCASRKIGGLYVAHTREDQAETFLLRLARGSGVDGLASMRPVAPYPLPGYGSVQIVRPLLDISRGDLRAWLKARGETWWEDPMNADTRFARVRIRQAWPLLAELGLTSDRVAAASRHLGRARDALDTACAQFLERACRFDTGIIVFDRNQFADIAPEIGLRALAQVLSDIGGEAYRPRFDRLESLFLSLCAGEIRTARTLHGCRVGRAPKRLAHFGASSYMVVREPARSRPRSGVAARGEIS